jgi:hypothetical protein
MDIRRSNRKKRERERKKISGAQATSYDMPLPFQEAKVF